MHILQTTVHTYPLYRIQFSVQSAIHGCLAQDRFPPLSPISGGIGCGYVRAQNQSAYLPFVHGTGAPAPCRSLCLSVNN